MKNLKRNGFDIKYNEPDGTWIWAHESGEVRTLVSSYRKCLRQIKRFQRKLKINPSDNEQE